MFERHAQVFAALGFPIDLSHPVFPPTKTLDENTSKIAGSKSQNWLA
jgi:hypothetical protein